MQRPLSSDYFVEMKKYYHIAVLTIMARAPSDYNFRILKSSILFITAFSFIFPLTDVFAQHMMMPPTASIGDRKIKLSFSTDPSNIKSN
jgi:hypothetical protein